MTNWRDERRGAEAIVREGEAAFPHIREQIEKHGPIHCWVGKGLDGVRCEHTAVMEVYGTPMCEDHGAEAKAGALEELYDDASQEISRPFNLHVRQMNPEAAAALRSAYSEVVQRGCEAEREGEAALLRAFPFEQGRVPVDEETVRYCQDPHDARARGYEPPYDAYRHARFFIHKLMRLAYEEGEDSLVALLGQQRESVAAQAAYALALEREAGQKYARRG